MATHFAFFMQIFAGIALAAVTWQTGSIPEVAVIVLLSTQLGQLTILTMRVEKMTKLLKKEQTD